MTLFPELRYRGLLSDVPTLPGLLGQPLGPQASQPPPQAAQPPPMPPQQPQGQQEGQGGLGSLLGSIFGGQDDPRLTPEQNAAAKHQALLQAGLAILASPDRGISAIAQGGLYGQQAGEQARESIYGRTQHDRYERALQDPKLMEGVPEYIKTILPYLPPGEGLKAILEARRNRYTNTGFLGLVLDNNSGQWVELPDGMAKPEAWAKGDVTKNPADGKYYNTWVLKSDPSKVRFVGEAREPTQKLVTDASGHRVPDVPGVNVPLPGSSAGGGGFGAGGIPGAGRAVSAINSLGIAHQNMKAYEQDVLAGRATFDGVDQFKARLAGHFDKNGVVDDVIFSAALADMGKNNPALATYMQNEYLWALEDATLSNRPSDFRTKLDTFVSAMKANPTPGTMKSIWDGREARLNGYQTILPALQKRLDVIAGQGGTAPAPKPKAKQSAGLFDDLIPGGG